MQNRAHARISALFDIQKWPERRSDFDFSSAIVLKRRSDFDFSVKLEAKWFPGNQNRGLEGPGTSKIGAWTVWKAVWRARGSSGRPSWGSKGRFGRHLGATWAPRGTFRERFWRIWGSQTGPERRFFGSGVEKCEIAKSFVLPCFSWFLRFGGSENRWKWGQVAGEIGAKWLVDTQHASWRLRMPSWGASWPPKTSQNGIWEASKGHDSV